MAHTGNWSIADLPDLEGKTVVVTGANSGIGYEACRAFARRGATVVLAARNQDRLDRATAQLRRDAPGATVDGILLDLADLGSVHRFADVFDTRYDSLDILCNNAGVMALPRRETADGFEMQFGTNHLGHFALTGLLLDKLLSAPAARVVTVSSLMHRIGKLDFDDLEARRRYHKWRVYGSSKLANLLFAFELQRRFEAARVDAVSVACHPGYSSTGLHLPGARMAGSALAERILTLGVQLVAQPASMGAWPMLYAAAAPDVRGGDFIGPSNLFEIQGAPTKVEASSRAHDPDAAARLWEASATRTKVRYDRLSH